MANIKFTQLPNLPQGNITANTIVPVVEANVNYTVTAANLQSYVNSTTGNVIAGGIISATGNIRGANFNTVGIVSATGNITGNYIIGDGSQLTNLPAGNYSNANVSAFLPTYTGNITSQNISATGDITAGFFVGDGSQITGLYGNANVANYLPTYTGGFTALTGNITTTANIQGAYISGNIANTTGGYGNANVQAVLQTYTGTLTAATVSATGNITGNYFIGNGSQLTGINVSTTYGNSNVATYLASGTNTSNIVTIGNVQGSFVKGNGSALTGLVSSIVAGTGITISGATGAVTITNNNPTPYTNANVAAYLPTYTGNLTAGNISTTGTITGTYLGNGAGLSNIVTSITAGSGISVNASTGAITITATGNGGGSGNSISFGTSSVAIDASNGNIRLTANGAVRMYVGADGTVNLNGNGFVNTSSISINGSLVTNNQVTAPSVTGNIVTAAIVMRNPVYTQASARLYNPGSSYGASIAISDSPTNAGRFAYWSVANARWQYFDTNAAV